MFPLYLLISLTKHLQWDMIVLGSLKLLERYEWAELGPNTKKNRCMNFQNRSIFRARAVDVNWSICNIRTACFASFHASLIQRNEIALCSFRFSLFYCTTATLCTTRIIWCDISPLHEHVVQLTPYREARECHEHRVFNKLG